MTSKSKRLSRHAPLFALVFLLLGALFLWEIAAQTGAINTVFFSSPSLIWQEFLLLCQTGLLWRHLSVTMHEALLGLFYGCVLGTIAGLLLGANKTLSALFMPLLVGLNSVPKLALAPLIILWFGIGLTSKVLMAGLMVFFIFTFNLYAGYRSVEVSLVNSVRLLGGTRRQIVRHVVWPSCLPWFLTSLRAGLGLSVSGAVVGEFLGASRGLGWLIQDAGSRYNLTRVLCCVFVIIAVMMLLDWLIGRLDRRLLKWRVEV